MLLSERATRDWKHALDKSKGFYKHQSSECHKEAMERCFTLPSEVLGEIDELFSSEKVMNEQFDNRTVLLKIIGNVRFLARQGIPLRGNWKEDKKCEEDSNFYQLFKLRIEDDHQIAEWLQRKGEKYTSPQIQNEILNIMALKILRAINRDIKAAGIYAILADETADVSNKEQLVFCIRWVDNNLCVNEDMIGMYPVKGTDADQLVFVIKDILMCLDLNIADARGQCYDGASAMAGAKTGVATQIKSINPKCLFTHCYGHALDLAVGDVFKNVPQLREALETAYL